MVSIGSKAILIFLPQVIEVLHASKSAVDDWGTLWNPVGAKHQAEVRGRRISAAHLFSNSVDRNLLWIKEQSITRVAPARLNPNSVEFRPT